MRELRHQVSRAMLLCHNSHITEADLALPAARLAGQDVAFLTQNKSQYHNLTTDELIAHQRNEVTLDEAEKTILLQALADTRNNVSKAARKLGITRMTMRYRMDKHQI